MLPTLSLALAACLPLQDPGPEASPWSGAVDAGLTAVNGNNSSITGVLNGKLEYSGESYSWRIGAGYAGVRADDPSTGNDMTTTRLYFAEGGHQRYLDEEQNLYVYGKGGMRRDVPNGLQLRQDAGLGGGYTFRWAEDSSSLSLEAGPSWLRENNVGAFSAIAATGRAAAGLDSALSDSLKLLGSAEYFQSFDEGEDRSFTGEIGLRWNVEGNWFIQGTVALAWDNTPGPGLSRSDVRYTAGAGTTF